MEGCISISDCGHVLRSRSRSPERKKEKRKRSRSSSSSPDRGSKKSNRWDNCFECVFLELKVFVFPEKLNFVFPEIGLDQGQGHQDDQRSQDLGPQENTRRSQDTENFVNLIFSHHVEDLDVEFTPCEFSSSFMHIDTISREWTFVTLRPRLCPDDFIPIIPSVSSDRLSLYLQPIREENLQMHIIWWLYPHYSSGRHNDNTRGDKRSLLKAWEV